MSGMIATLSTVLAEQAAQTVQIKDKLAGQVAYTNYLASVHRSWAVKQYNLIHADHFCGPAEQEEIWDLVRGVAEGTAYSPHGAKILEVHREYLGAEATFNAARDKVLDLCLELQNLDGVLRNITVTYDDLVDCATKVEINPSL